MGISYGQSDIAFFAVYVISRLVIAAVFIAICYKLAKNGGLPKAYAFFGLLGAIGIIIVAVISSVNKVNRQNRGMGNMQGGYGQNIRNMQGGNQQNTGDTFRTETINSSNYEFKGGMNVCETHDMHKDTYSSPYGDFMADREVTYNLNGENVTYGKGMCTHCGAKLKKFSRFCDNCGNRV